MDSTIFEELRNDHQKQRTLVQILAKTSGDSEGRREIFEKLKNELEAHAAAEEKTLYAEMMRYDNTLEKARHSVAEHKELDDLLEKMEETDYSSPAWIAIAKNLEERLIHHLNEEEQEVFKSAGYALGKESKQLLGKQYVQEMQVLR
ncbi:hemerythrin domain-containing protein [Pseudobacteriovorax antillogorgiicola]|uniref:Hemerythrin HHE cation binding domain-containing protein n=1 Tax=Pseudobacteriovorax antillogorgiicola TaxID=1513793 RepID=A0A1Y6BMG3_9BACT|nr:hemerythrin domain-containing protein [Pseudobacteriovorax antillogorgiicola]TCS54575.1 hemerythrin HHE cation binding domain-containing protein [Pseudobacteriovorax antillogorgiicola]SMF18002.1 Hemerythrin HHE cation binding domain-containing protein [Pseudobacteriovorax antillogorgiicola]